MEENQLRLKTGRSITIFMVVMMIIIDCSHVNATELVTEAGKSLEGIGYREQELQLAKGTNFESELPKGV